MHITHWFELLYKIPLMFTKEISNSYFMSLPKSRPRELVRTLNEGSFFSCQKSSSQVYLALVSFFSKIFTLTLFIIGYSRKNPNWWGWGYIIWTPPGIFHFFTIPLEIPDKIKLNPRIIHKIVLDPLEIPRPKATIPWNSTLFFLVTLGNSNSFLINPRQFHMLFLRYL